MESFTRTASARIGSLNFQWKRANSGIDTALGRWILNGMQALVATLAAELERPRSVSAQVINHITATYGVERDTIGAFLKEKLSGLEDFEIDLILSPLFTPGLDDQAVFAELLGQTAVPREQWPGLIEQLIARPTVGHLITESDQTEDFPLRQVTIERYVNRLRLDATIPDPLFRLLGTISPPDRQPLLKAIARRAIWESAPRREILFRYLLEEVRGEARGVEEILELLKLMETYAPVDQAALLQRIPQWEQVLRQEMTMATNPKPFFNERVQELHGGGRDQRSQDNVRVAAKERELAFLQTLKTRLATA